jgi:hypothetical protein
MDRVAADLAETTALVKVIAQKLSELITTVQGGGRNGNPQRR